MISFTTGTNVPRLASSTNSSKVVCFINHGSDVSNSSHGSHGSNSSHGSHGSHGSDSGHGSHSSHGSHGSQGAEGSDCERLLRGVLEQAAWRPLSGPDFKLTFCLRHEHLQAADDGASLRLRGLQQRGQRRVVHEVVDNPAVDGE